MVFAIMLMWAVYEPNRSIKNPENTNANSNAKKKLLRKQYYFTFPCDYIHWNREFPGEQSKMLLYVTSNSFPQCANPHPL